MKKNEFNLLTYRPTKASKPAESLFGIGRINWSLILKGTFVGSLGTVVLYLAVQENLFVPELVLGMAIVLMLVISRAAGKKVLSLKK